MFGYPLKEITASELAQVNASVISDHIVKEYHFWPNYSPSRGIVQIDPGECWLAGRYWNMDSRAEFVLDPSKNYYFSIRLDTTPDIPVFSIVAENEIPDVGAGVYNILLFAVIAGGLIQYDYPVSRTTALGNKMNELSPYLLQYNASKEGYYLSLNQKGAPVRREYLAMSLVENANGYQNVILEAEATVFEYDIPYSMTVVRRGTYGPACTVALPGSWGMSASGLANKFSFGSSSEGNEVITVKWIRASAGDCMIWWVEDLSGAIIEE